MKAFFDKLYNALRSVKLAVVLLVLLALFAIAGGIYRYQKDRFSYSSFSSQFLENRMLFWGSTTFHYAIILILLAHLWQGLWPEWSNAWLGTPLTLFMAELGGYILGYVTIIGLAILIFRRLFDPKARQVTTIFDWLMFALYREKVLPLKDGR